MSVVSESSHHKGVINFWLTAAAFHAMPNALSTCSATSLTSVGLVILWILMSTMHMGGSKDTLGISWTAFAQAY